MKKAVTFLFAMAISMTIFSQNVDFEEFNLNTNEYLNGSDGSGGFYSGGFFFPNSYNANWDSWSGWSVSTMTDTQTPGYENQYSAITGSGAEGSQTYAVSYVNGHTTMSFPEQGGLSYVHSFKVTNSTYAYLSMKEGDGFAKKFGGADGNDPDFFLLTIKGFVNGQLVEDSVDFFLADYRFSDNSMDYIVDGWVEVNTLQLGHVDSLHFILSSSDVSSFGFNTPAYFCIDDVLMSIESGSSEQLAADVVTIFPNPTIRELSIHWKENETAEAYIFSANGQLVQKSPIVFGQQTLDVQALPSGSYFLKIQSEEGWISKRFVKE